MESAGLEPDGRVTLIVALCVLADDLTVVLDHLEGRVDTRIESSADVLKGQRSADNLIVVWVLVGGRQSQKGLHQQTERILLVVYVPR